MMDFFFFFFIRVFLGLATGSSAPAFSLEGEAFDAKLLNMLNLVTNARVGWSVGLRVVGGGVVGKKVLKI